MNNRKYQWNFNHVGLFRQLRLTYFVSVSSASKTIRERILQKPELFFLKRDLTGPMHCKKNKVFAEPTKKGSVDVKSFRMSSNVERNNKKILPNLKRFFTSIQSRNLIKKNLFKFRTTPKRLLTKPSGSVFSLRNSKVCSFFLRNLFRCCTKLKKVFLIRFRDCIEVKNLFRFGRIFLLFLSTFELIWKLLPSTEPFLMGSGKTLFFLECGIIPSFRNADS